jgi:hypothetical protein
MKVEIWRSSVQVPLPNGCCVANAKLRSCCEPEERLFAGFHVCVSRVYLMYCRYESIHVISRNRALFKSTFCRRPIPAIIFYPSSDIAILFSVDAVSITTWPRIVLYYPRDFQFDSLVAISQHLTSNEEFRVSIKLATIPSPELLTRFHQISSLYVYHTTT